MIKIEKRTISLLGILTLFTFSCLLSNCASIKEHRQAERTEARIRNHIVKYARDFEGTRYRYAGKSPKGFDCSGFTGYVFNKEGIKLAASSKKQSKQGEFRDVKKAKPGDLVFFGPPFKIDHVGIVTQNKRGKLKVIHSTNSQGVVEHDINQILYWKKRLKFARDVISP